MSAARTPIVLDVLPEARVGPVAPVVRDNLPEAAASVAAPAPAVEPSAVAPAAPVPVAPAAPVPTPVVPEPVPAPVVPEPVPAPVVPEPAAPVPAPDASAETSAPAAATASTASDTMTKLPEVISITIPGCGPTYDLRKYTIMQLMQIGSSCSGSQLAERFFQIAKLAENDGSVRMSVGSTHPHVYTAPGSGLPGLYRVKDNKQVLSGDELDRAVEDRVASMAKERAERATEAIAAAIATIVAEAAHLPPVVAADADAAVMAAWVGLVREKGAPTKATAVAILEAAVLVARAVPRA